MERPVNIFQVLQLELIGSGHVLEARVVGLNIGFGQGLSEGILATPCDTIKMLTAIAAFIRMRCRLGPALQPV